MSNGLKYILAALAGAAVGSAVTWKIVKTRYERIAQEEIDSVKEFYSKNNGKKTEDSTEETPNKKEENKQLISEYINHISPYTATSDDKEQKGGSDSMDKIGPQVISPDEYGEILEYETISLTYYADDVLADDMDEVIEDVESVVGYNFADHFDEYGDDPDTVYIVNHRLKCYYEICKDDATYSEIALNSGNNP